MKILTIFTVALLGFNISNEKAWAAPHELPLNSSRSQIDISVRSQVINTSGSLTDYTGSFLYDPNDLKNSRLEINADASKVSFGALPFDQMILLTGLIRSIPNPDISFVSDSIERSSPNRLLIRGTASAGNNKESVAIPFEVSELTQNLAILKGSYSRAGLIGNKRNPQSRLFGIVTSRSIFKLVFQR